jgi:hypothetical protein
LKYLLNMAEVERLMKLKGIKSISQLMRESGLKPTYFFSKQSKQNNRPVVSLHQVYVISRRLDCKIEDILIVETI